MDWKAGWAQRHPWRWGAFNAVGFFIGVLVFAALRRQMTPTAILLALGVALIVMVLGTAGGYLARRIKPY